MEGFDERTKEGMSQETKLIEIVAGALLFFFVIFFVVFMTRPLKSETNRHNTFWVGCVEAYTYFVTKKNDFVSREKASEWCVERYQKVSRE